MISPTIISFVSTSTSLPSLKSVAFLGDNFIRLFKASVVLPLDLASSILPKVIKVRIVAADSK